MTSEKIAELRVLCNEVNENPWKNRYVFIEAARTALPEALDEIERLRAGIAELRGESRAAPRVRLEWAHTPLPDHTERYKAKWGPVSLLVMMRGNGGYSWVAQFLGEIIFDGGGYGAFYDANEAKAACEQWAQEQVEGLVGELTR